MKGSSRELFKHVVEAGLCTFCGACASSCPYLVPYKGKIIMLDNCTLPDGQCYHYCPRTYTDMDAISQRIFGVSYYDGSDLGVTGEILIAKSTDDAIQKNAQYGGVVTTLVLVAKEEGLIESAIMTKTS